MRWFQPIIAVAGVLATSACYTMKTVTLDDLSANKSGRVWVTHPDETQTVVHDAQVFRGNLVGFVDGKYRELTPTQVRAVRVRRLSSGKTGGLIAAGALGFAATVVLLAGAENHFDNCVGNDDEDCP